MSAPYCESEYVGVGGWVGVCGVHVCTRAQGLQPPLTTTNQPIPILQGLKPSPSPACEPPGLMGVLNFGTLPLRVSLGTLTTHPQSNVVVPPLPPIPRALHPMLLVAPSPSPPPPARPYPLSNISPPTPPVSTVPHSTLPPTHRASLTPRTFCVALVSTSRPSAPCTSTAPSTTTPWRSTSSTGSRQDGPSWCQAAASR